MPLYKRVTKKGKPDKTGQEYEDYLATMKKKGKKTHKSAVTEYQWRHEMNWADREMAKTNARIH
jgi:hypothetical protein